PAGGSDAARSAGRARRDADEAPDGIPVRLAGHGPRGVAVLARGPRPDPRRGRSRGTDHARRRDRRRGVEPVRRVAAAWAAAVLLGGSAIAAAQEPAKDDKPTLRIVSPTAADLPAGDTRIEAAVEGALPGDAVDFFVDGRKVGSAAATPW